MSGARVEHVVTSGIFSIDSDDFEVDNNIWLVGDDHEVIVVDAAHEAAPIVEAVGDRSVTAIVCTHGHNDHINAAVDLAGATGAPILIHQADAMLWDDVYPDRAPDGTLAEGDTITVAGLDLTVLHTPGHSPGGICLHEPVNGWVFGGDTLFRGGPGATGRSFSSFDTIIESIRTKLLTLPAETVVHTGHGDTTTIGDEAPALDDWIARGH
ncbi:MBL fold metallo-hydrolase [Actinospongicola halichondriae]|uniref:MBL fold metallo-hydrolase n=1 Tax=Actinospongicola halichondriae TaxID=3236844 RepID=UPI003D4195B0